MGRTSGTRNANFEEKKRAYARRALDSWLESGPGASLREIASGADMSMSNLRHYFGDREGLFEAITISALERGRPHMDQSAVPQGDDARSSLLIFLKQLVMAWRFFRVGQMHTLGLSEGFGNEQRGPSYVNHILEPTLVAGERLLAALIARGDLPTMNVRAASLNLLSPIVFALLHQDALHGNRCRPLDIDALIPSQVETFLFGHASTQQDV